MEPIWISPNSSATARVRLMLNYNIDDDADHTPDRFLDILSIEYSSSNIGCDSMNSGLFIIGGSRCLRVLMDRVIIVNKQGYNSAIGVPLGFTIIGGAIAISKVIFRFVIYMLKAGLKFVNEYKKKKQAGTSSSPLIIVKSIEEGKQHQKNEN